MSAVPQQNVQIRRNGSHIGNFPLQSMRSLVSSGMILPTDHYLYEGMNDWQAVGETWAERPQPPAKEPAAAVADPSALKEYIVWYEDRPTGPRKIASHSPLNAAKDFALQSAHGAQEFVVCVRIDQAKDVHKFKRSAGVWSNVETLIMSPLSPNSPRENQSVSSFRANTRVETLLENPPRSLTKAQSWILVPMYITVLVVLVLLASCLVLLSSTMGVGPAFWTIVFVGAIFFGAVAVCLSTWLVDKMMTGANWSRIVFIVGDAMTLINIAGQFVYCLFLAAVFGPIILIGSAFLVLASIPAIVRLCLLCRRETSEWFQRVRLLRDEQLRAAI